MKNSVLLFITILFFITSCEKNGKSENTVLSDNPDKTCVEILYFHGDMRCRNCVAMEKGISELLADHFNEEVNKGKIIFKTIDITTAEGEQIADNYNVSWSSLYLNNWKEGREERNDLTKMGMQTAAKKPDEFKEEIKRLINNYLK